MPSEPPLTLGEKVVIMGKRKGTVRYIGDTAYGPGEWVGVELEKPTGTHDGGVNGQVLHFHGFGTSGLALALTSDDTLCINISIPLV